MTSDASPVENYFESLKNILSTNPIVIGFTVKRERVGSSEGLIQISVQLVKAFLLDIFEFYNMDNGVTGYRYQVMTNTGDTVLRWDNASHHPEISSYPHHVHRSDGIHESKQPTILQILDELLEYI